ncbi:MAG: signal peptidase I [Clostridia bacterium]|nr:signal peptidase I [Clostridia bacterium]
MKTSGKTKSFLYELSDVFAVAMLIILIVTAFFIRVINVSGTSMEPTLHEADRLVLSSFCFTPERGDIIVSSQPNSKERLLIKRIVAVEGDTIDINWSTGDVSINGVVIDEEFVSDTYFNTFCDHKNDFPLTVPEGYSFVMGDNRLVSWDSRYKEVGLIRNDYIMGSVSLRLNDFKSF